MSEEMNITEVFIGCQGSGKSWAAMQRAAEIADKWDCPIVIHECGSAAIRKKKNPYHEQDWELFRSSTPPFRIRFPDICVVNTADAKDALPYVSRLQAMNKRHKEVVLLLDEITACKEMYPATVLDPWRTIIAQRRAMKIALLICMQTPTLVNRFVSGTATSIRVFHLDDDLDIKAARGKGFSDEQIALIRTLKRGEYIERAQGMSVEQET